VRTGEKLPNVANIQMPSDTPDSDAAAMASSGARLTNRGPSLVASDRAAARPVLSLFPSPLALISTLCLLFPCRSDITVALGKASAVRYNFSIRAKCQAKERLVAQKSATRRPRTLPSTIDFPASIRSSKPIVCDRLRSFSKGRSAARRFHASMR
jgi:hypothetical protein